MTTKKAALSFTGGKDCLLALSEVNNKLEVEVTVLVTFGPPEAFLTEEEEVEVEGTSEDSEMKMKESNPKEKKRKKKTFLAHPLRVIKMQALAIGLPHVVIPIEGPNYLESYANALRLLMFTQGVTHLVTGDILDVCNQFMQKAADEAGTVLLRPLWERPRRELLALMMPHPSNLHSSLLPSSSSPGFTFLLSCCSVDKMGRERARAYVGMEGERVLEKLMNLAMENEERRERKTRNGERQDQGKAADEEDDKEIDACGEGGEYHSMVLDMPLFRHGRLDFKDGVKRAPVLLSDDKKYLYCDLDDLIFVKRE